MDNIIASTYEIIEKIGAGGAGVVYLAKHIRLNKLVVLKADKRKITTRPEILRREVDVLKDLRHTYIAQVYDYFTEGDIVYTVIDYIEGESLDKALKKNIRLSQKDIIKWACQLLEALCYLHNPVHGSPPRGIVHSDIKPANIMLTKDGNICLIDFNISLALGEENVVGLSFGYASPEHYGISFSNDSSFSESSSKLNSNLFKSISDIFKGNTKNDSKDTTADLNAADNNAKNQTLTISNPNGKADKDLTQSLDLKDKKFVVMSASRSIARTASGNKVVVPDVRSDIYSVGATLYHLFSGQRPAVNPVDTEPLKNVSPQISSIVAKAMNPNADLRYQSAEEMLWDFTHLRENDIRTKRMKKAAAAAAVINSAILLIGIFFAFTGLKRMQGTQSMLTLAEYSSNALENGDIDKAVEYALEALPENRNIFTPSYTSQAEKALADALGVYDLSDSFKSHNVLELPSEAFKIALSPDGKTGAAVYSFETALFDAETGEIRARLPILKSALSDVVFVDNNTVVYAGEDGITLYDIEKADVIWKNKKASHIAVSSDGKTIAGIYRDENFASVYDIDGTEKAVINFGENKQKIVENDTFADPRDNLAALSGDGRYLAVSFENGGMTIYDISRPDESIEIYESSDFTHFEGGFSGKYFAFSTTREGLSEFSIINMDSLEQTVGLASDGYIKVRAYEDAIYISDASAIVTINPETGEQKDAAFADSDIKDFSADDGNLAAITEKNEYLFYNKNAYLTQRYSSGQITSSYADLRGDYAVAAGNDTPFVRIFKRKLFEGSDLLQYDENYVHYESRVNQEQTKCMLFGYEGFRIYDLAGNIIKEQYMPDAANIRDQQYSRKSGNLAVIYDDAFRLYSGETGDSLFEETGLKSVFYAPYGVSIYDGKEVRLIDIDTGEALVSEKASGNFGAYCGIVVDDEFLGGKELIGAANIDNDYVFAVSDGVKCFVYDGKGNEKFSADISEQSEAFFTRGEIIFSPLHGTPSVYSLKDGRKKADLEKDSYLTYITELDDYVMSQYTSAENADYGILLDKDTYEPLARIPSLKDAAGNEILLDYNDGKLRRTHIYSLKDLINTARKN